MNLKNFADTLSGGDFFGSLKQKAEENFLPPAENRTPIWDIMKQSIDAGREVFFEKTAGQIRQSPTGQRVEGEAKKQAIVDMIMSPIGIIVIGALIMAIVWKLRR